MRSLVTIIIEHGEDTDELESFVSNLHEDNRFAYPSLEIEDYGVRVDIPSTLTLPLRGHH